MYSVLYVYGLHALLGSYAIYSCLIICVNGNNSTQNTSKLNRTGYVWESWNWDTSSVSYTKKWINQGYFNGDSVLLINHELAGENILKFASFANNFLQFKVSSLDIAGLKKYSSHLNKHLKYLSEFPDFVRDVVGNISHPGDVSFLNNAIDIFSVLEIKRHVSFAKVYRSLKSLFTNRNGELGEAPFGVRSMLLAFTKHIKNEEKRLQQFLRFLLSASSNNVYLPSRYKKGSLPGVDKLLEAQNISSPLEQVLDGPYYVIPSLLKGNYCITETFDFATNKTFLKIESHENLTNCLLLRLSRNASTDDGISVSVGEPQQRTFRLRPPPHNAIELVSHLEQFEIQSMFQFIKLVDDDSFLIVQLTPNDQIFLSYSTNTKTVHHTTKYLAGEAHWKLTQAVQ